MGMCKALSRGAWVLERGRADVSETQCPGKTENILKFQSVFRVGRGDEELPPTRQSWAGRRRGRRQRPDHKGTGRSKQNGLRENAFQSAEALCYLNYCH